jgi:transposase
MRCELTDHEWAAIKPMLPNKPRGVPRVNDRRVLNGIFWVLGRNSLRQTAANYLAFIQLASVRLRINEFTP